MFTMSYKGKVYSLERVYSVEHLAILTEQKRSVFMQYQGHLPASVVLNWQGTHLLKCIKNGMWIYPKADEMTKSVKIDGFHYYKVDDENDSCDGCCFYNSKAKYGGSCKRPDDERFRGCLEGNFIWKKRE